MLAIDSESSFQFIFFIRFHPSIAKTAALRPISERSAWWDIHVLGASEHVYRGKLPDVTLQPVYIPGIASGKGKEAWLTKWLIPSGS